MNILRDRAIFAESPSLRFRSIMELGKFGPLAIPVIQEVIDSMIGIDKERFAALCHKVIEDVQDERFC